MACDITYSIVKEGCRIRYYKTYEDNHCRQITEQESEILLCSAVIIEKEESVLIKGAYSTKEFCITPTSTEITSISQIEGDGTETSITLPTTPEELASLFRRMSEECGCNSGDIGELDITLPDDFCCDETNQTLTAHTSLLEANNELLTQILEELRDREDFEPIVLCDSQGNVYYRHYFYDQETKALTINVVDANGVDYTGTETLAPCQQDFEFLYHDYCVNGEAWQRVDCYTNKQYSESFFLNLSGDLPVIDTLPTGPSDEIFRGKCEDTVCRPDVQTFYFSDAASQTIRPYNNFMVHYPKCCRGTINVGIGDPIIFDGTITGEGAVKMEFDCSLTDFQINIANPDDCTESDRILVYLSHSGNGNT